MSKIKIYFDNKDYSIDESSMVSASDSLKSHLSNVMNGTGAVINLGGTSYNIDSTKLTAATNTLVSYFGKISGNGKKVTINGVEYSIDATRLENAISDMHAVLGNMKTEDDAVVEPEKNQYGFYFNVPYVFEYDDGGNVYTNAIVFYSNGDVLEFYGSYYMDAPEPLSAGDIYTINYDELENNGFQFSEDGKSLTYYESTGTINGVVHSIYFGETYVSEDGDTFTPYRDNRTVYTGSLSCEEKIEEWKGYGHYGQSYWSRVYASVDGTVVYAGDRNAGLKKYYCDASTPKLEKPMLSIINETLNIAPVEGATMYEVYCEDTLITTTAETSIDLSQFIAEKNTYVIVKAVGHGYRSSDLSFVEYGINFVPGLYKTGAVAIYESEGVDAVKDMLVSSWGELVIDGYIIQEDTTLTEASSLLDGDLIFSNKITSVEYDALRDCSNITGVVLQDGLETIANGAFYGCKKMSIIVMPSRMTSIDGGSFYQCDSLTNVVIPDGISHIEGGIFDNCDNLTTISLPDSLISIGKKAFGTCNSLECIIYRGTTEQFASIELATEKYPEWYVGILNSVSVITCTDGEVSIR